MKPIIPQLFLVVAGLFVPTWAQGDPLPPQSHSILYEEKSAQFYGSEGLRQIPTNAANPRLDYQSILRIVVDTNELNKAIGPRPNSLPPLSAEQKSRLELIVPLIEKAQVTVVNHNRFIATYAELKKTNASAASKDRLFAELRRAAAARVDFLEPLLSYTEAKTREEYPQATEAEIITTSTNLAWRFVKVYPNDGRLHINLPELAGFIAAESRMILGQTEADVATVRANGSVSLRMRAFRRQSGEDPVRLHIRNYDNLSDANVEQEPRISFQMSDRDRERITMQSKALAEAVKLSKDLKNSQSDVRQGLDSVLRGLRGDLQSWKSAVTNLDSLQATLQPVINALDKAGASTQLTGNLSNLIVQTKADLTGTIADIKALRDTVNNLTANIRPDADSAEVLVAALDAVMGSVNTGVKLSDNVGVKLSRIIAGLTTLRTDLTAIATQDPDRLQGLVEALKEGAPSSVTAITKLKDTVLANYANLAAAFLSLQKQSEIIAAGVNFPPIELDPNLIDVSTVNPPDGFISLKKNFPSGDASLEFSAALVTSTSPTNPPSAMPIEERDFKVEKFGWVNTWSANLIFVKRLGELGPTEEDSQFAPAPSISWTLHYNQPPKSKGHYEEQNKFMEVFVPGWGINVATLDWNDSIQLGLGTHVSIFKDTITIGGGWNLNESRHGGYVFIGIGLFEVFNQLGLGGKTALGR